MPKGFALIAGVEVVAERCRPCFTISFPISKECSGSDSSHEDECKKANKNFSTGDAVHRILLFDLDFGDRHKSFGSGDYGYSMSVNEHGDKDWST